MALLSNHCKILPAVLIDLTFEDEIRKQFVVHQNDIVSVLYNKAGLATRHVGKVTQIGSGDYRSVASIPKFYGASGIASYDTVLSTQPGAGDYMIIDGSGDFAGNVVVVYLNTILDISMVNQYDANLAISSAKANSCCGINQVTTFRVQNGKLQYSPDYGQNWHNVDGTNADDSSCQCDCNCNTSSETPETGG